MDIASHEADDLIGLANALGDAAGAAILPYFRSKRLVAENKLKTGFDPVTIADRAAEKAMRDMLGLSRPNDGILGEEYGTRAGESGLTWVLDPIDGTRGFISGTPTWGTLIALSDETGPRLGLIDQPYTGERFLGGFGRAEWTGPRGSGGALKVSEAQRIEEAVLFTTFPELGSPEEGAAFARVARHVRLTRYGMDCYAYALLAMGQVDLVIEAGLQPYDIQAPIAVIEAAGGIVTNWQGGPAHEGGRAIAAASPALHAAALDLLNEVPT